MRGSGPSSSALFTRQRGQGRLSEGLGGAGVVGGKFWARAEMLGLT